MTEKAKPAGSYIRVAVGLMALLGLTLGLSFVDLGQANLPVALAIAGLKAGLVVVFFMHVRSGPSVTRLAALAGLFWLAFMFALTLSDILTRS